MKRREFLKAAVATGATMALPIVSSAATAAAQSKEPGPSVAPVYPVESDSVVRPGVPNGTIFDFVLDDSTFFPGTQRTIDVYVPAQYTASTPSCVLIALDGLGHSIPIVLNNLIHKQEMPVTIAIGLRSGSAPSSQPPQNPRLNRSFEFDSLTDVLADFILHALLPEVEKRRTPDGLPIILSRDPNDRGITGGSTGGIGSFTVAWRRPDAFRRVFTSIGTFVGMRGGDRYPVLIRKTEAKPIRVFMQDGSRDGWPGGLEFGDWWMSNQEVERALSFAGYEVNHVWGVDGHNGRQAEAILPDVMRWLWKDWPKPVEAGQSGNFNITAIVTRGEDWKDVLGERSSSNVEAFHFQGYGCPPLIDDHSTAAALTSDSQGRVYVQNVSDGGIYRINAANQLELFVKAAPGNNGLALGPDGHLYVAETRDARIVAFNADGKAAIIARGLRGCGLTVTHNGNIYVTEAGENSASSGRVWLIRPNGAKSIAAEGLNGPSGICVTPDGLWLCVAESKGHHAYSYQVRADGDLRYGQPFYWFHVPDPANDSGVSQVCTDCEGRTYAATRLGVQVFDRNGRVTAIFPVASSQLAGICFGGSDFRTLYVTTGNKVFRRNMKVAGMPSWEPPIILPPPTAG